MKYLKLALAHLIRVLPFLGMFVGLLMMLAGVVLALVILGVVVYVGVKEHNLMPVVVVLGTLGLFFLTMRFVCEHWARWEAWARRQLH